MTKPIRKAELHSVRIDSDVWRALKAHGETLNALLRRVLLARKAGKRR